MTIHQQSENRTILGALDKEKNKVTNISDKYPLVLKENLTPFLVTRDAYFEIDANRLKIFLGNFLNEKAFNTVKNTLANILIIPGLLVALLYLFKYFGIFTHVALLETFWNTNIINSFFWVSLLGVLILWHDHAFSKSPFRKLPNAPYIPVNEVNEIESVGFKFGRYGQIDLTKHIASDLVDIFLLATKNGQVDSEKMFDTLLSRSEIQELFKRADINIELIKNINEKKEIFEKLSSSSISQLLIYSLEEALLTNCSEILPIHLFLTLVKVNQGLEKIFNKSNISLNILREVTTYLIEETGRFSFGIFNPLSTYVKEGGIGKSWVYGSEYILDRFSKDINEIVSRKEERYGIGHEKEMDELISVLSKSTKKNALLIGESGVGKSSLIKGVAVSINSIEVPESLVDNKVIHLNVSELISYLKGKKSLKESIRKDMDTLVNEGKTILFIDDLSQFIPSKTGLEGEALLDIFMPYIQNDSVSIVGTTNYSDYKKYFYTQEDFRQSFTNIEVLPLSAKDTIEILKSKIFDLEKNYKLYITFPAIFASVEYAQKHISESMLPSSAVNLLEDSCEWANNNEIKVLTQEHIAKVISLNSNVVVSDISNAQSETFFQQEENVKKQVIGQDEGIQIIFESLRKKTEEERKLPTAFLFAGTKGVGKEYIAKTIYSQLQNGEFLTFEFKEEYVEDELLETLENIGISPYSSIYLKNIELIRVQTQEVLVNILKTGEYLSKKGKVIDFSNVIFFATTEVGSVEISENIKESMWEDTKNLVMMKLKQVIANDIFENINATIIFKPYTKDNLAKIADMLLEDIRVSLEQKDIKLDWNATIPMLIVSKIEDISLGATIVKKYIQEKIEGNITQEIINGEIKKGGVINIKESWIV
ncbi:AAA family ATPase [Candidatus Dojkabacteria bacterium]|jgi:ATP-dependent Clp protease ATP-binding subunit ClpA|nr:AAA family ATPase [Candidatus Dojkabacteria bacterium]